MDADLAHDAVCLDAQPLALEPGAHAVRLEPARAVGTHGRLDVAAVPAQPGARPGAAARAPAVARVPGIVGFRLPDQRDERERRQRRVGLGPELAAEPLEQAGVEPARAHVVVLGERAAGRRRSWQGRPR